MKSFEIIGRILLAIVFLAAGLLKLWDPNLFAIQIRHYQITSWHGAVFLALWLPWFEIAAGTVMLFPRWKQAGLFCIITLILVFMVALTTAWMRGLNIDCGCFGVAGFERSIQLALIEDLALLAIAVFLWFTSKSKYQSH
jgi:putative oxidoreductase